MEYPPDAGPYAATAAAGVVTIGAVPWVTNFNVPLYTEDMAAAKAIARAVSAKGGGLPGVEVSLRRMHRLSGSVCACRMRQQTACAAARYLVPLQWVDSTVLMA
jgi:hypothetical protein